MSGVYTVSGPGQLLRSRSAAPILTAECPWEEEGLLSAVALLPDPGGDRMRLHYLVMHRQRPLDNVLCLATSTAWRGPPLHGWPIITNANDAMSMIAGRRGLGTPLGGPGRLAPVSADLEVQPRPAAGSATT